MKASCAIADRRGNASVRARASARWSGFGSGNGIGARPRGAGSGLLGHPAGDNPVILIANARPAYIRAARDRNEANAALGR